MIPDRYPAPFAASAFHEQFKLNQWWFFTKTYAIAMIADDPDLDNAEKDRLKMDLMTAEVPDPQAVATRETHTHHDVVAFLSLMEDRLPMRVLPYVHVGLTSSDLVENAHHVMLRRHAELMAPLLNDLARAGTRFEATKNPRAGRTHGQLADITTFGHQIAVHRHTLYRLSSELFDYANAPVYKSPGPTGNTPHKIRRDPFVLARLSPESITIPSTQVLPRDFQIKWASLYLRVAVELEAYATLIRCGARSDIGELQEGTAVGSSAMPHKRNPVLSEKVCGLARLARGYFMTIAENGALWDDRDISNSSVERVAVPDLAATVEHMTHTMTQVIQGLDINLVRMYANANHGQTASNILQSLAQKHLGMGPVAANQYVSRNIRFGSGTFWFRAPEADDFDGDVDPRVPEWLEEAKSIWDGLFI